jgi:hypothetical protein
MKVMDKVLDESYPPLSSNKCGLFVISNMKNMDESLEGKIGWKN